MLEKECSEAFFDRFQDRLDRKLLLNPGSRTTEVVNRLNLTLYTCYNKLHISISNFQLCK